MAWPKFSALIVRLVMVSCPPETGRENVCRSDIFLHGSFVEIEGNQGHDCHHIKSPETCWVVLHIAAWPSPSGTSPSGTSQVDESATEVGEHPPTSTMSVKLSSMCSALGLQLDAIRGSLLTMHEPRRTAKHIMWPCACAPKTYLDRKNAFVLWLVLNFCYLLLLSCKLEAATSWHLLWHIHGQVFTSAHRHWLIQVGSANGMRRKLYINYIWTRLTKHSFVGKLRVLNCFICFTVRSATVGKNWG